MIRILNVYYPTRTVILFLLEAILVCACFLTGCWIRLGPDTYISLMYEQGIFKIACMTVLIVGLSYYFDLYEPQIVSETSDMYFRILLVIGCSSLLLACVLFFFPAAAIGSYVYAVGLGLLAPGLIFWRNAFDRIVSLPAFREKVYVLGAGDQARAIVETIGARRDLGMEIVSWGEFEGLDKADRKQIWVDSLNRLMYPHPQIQRVIIAVEDGRQELPVEDLLNVRFLGVSVEKVGDLQERLCGKIQLDGLRPSTFLYAEGFRIRRSQQIAQQIVSMVAAAIGLLLFLPAFPFVLVAIRLTSKGPIFFRQSRVGLGGATFYVYKFRSMFTDAESAGARWATKNDPRVTRFGMFMRKTRIDEIPQLWNVLKGDMSLVGPRPERPEFIPMLTEALPFYYMRHLIRPGLTGWAQVRYGYGATIAEMREKLEYDLYYVKHMSLGLDLLIMFETIKIIIRRRGAQ